MKSQYLISALAVLIWGIFLYGIIGHHNGSYISPSGCLVTTIQETVRGVSMEPLIHDGDELDVLNNYYTCWGEISRWDVVILENSATHGPYVKVLRALPGDTVRINADGSVNIAWEIMKNSTGQIYIFDKNEQNFLSLYIHNDILQKDAYLVFWDNISSSRDSRKFGWVHVTSFLGKVVSKWVR